MCCCIYPVSSKLGFVWIHHVCFYRILEFTQVLTSLISSYRWLLAWSICEDKHLQQGTSRVLLWSSLYPCAAQTTQCMWSVKWKMTQRMELGANTHVHLEAKWPWMLNHTEVSCSLCNLLFSCIGKSKSTPICPSWCLYAGLSFSTTNGEENKKWNLQENRINLFAGVSWTILNELSPFPSRRNPYWKA